MWKRIKEQEVAVQTEILPKELELYWLWPKPFYHLERKKQEYTMVRIHGVCLKPSIKDITGPILSEHEVYLCEDIRMGTSKTHKNAACWLCTFMKGIA